MWFDVQAALEKIEGGPRSAPEVHPPVTSAKPATKSVHVANVASVATPKTFPHGVSVAGNPLTWTGRVVSLDQYRRLSDWEKNGPNGRHWCGITRNWNGRT